MATVKYAWQRSSRRNFAGVCGAFHGAGLEGGHASVGRLQRWPGFSFFYIITSLSAYFPSILPYWPLKWYRNLHFASFGIITFELHVRVGDFCPATQTHTRQLRFHWQRDLSLPPKSGEKKITKKRQIMGKNREGYYCNQDQVNQLLFSSRMSWSGHESNWSLRSRKNSSECQRA